MRMHLTLLETRALHFGKYFLLYAFNHIFNVEHLEYVFSVARKDR